MNAVLSTAKRWALIVDDDLDLVEIISALISGMGFKVVSATKILDAKYKIKNQKFDFVLLDMRLGAGSGEEIIELVRQDKHEFNHTTPIIVMSGFLDLELIGRIGKDVNDILVKPFDQKVLADRINSVLISPQQTLIDRRNQKKVIASF